MASDTDSDPYKAQLVFKSLHCAGVIDLDTKSGLNTQPGTWALLARVATEIYKNLYLNSPLKGASHQNRST
jgi:hypothetical protein